MKTAVSGLNRRRHGKYINFDVGHVGSLKIVPSTDGYAEQSTFSVAAAQYVA